MALQAQADGLGLLTFLEEQAVRHARAVAADDDAAAEILGITPADLRKRVGKRAQAPNGKG